MESSITIISYVSPGDVQEAQYEAARGRLHTSFSTTSESLHLLPASVTDRFALSKSLDTTEIEHDTSWFHHPKPVVGDIGQISSLIAPVLLGQPMPSRRLGMSAKQPDTLTPKLVLSGLEKSFEQHSDQRVELKFKATETDLHSSPSVVKKVDTPPSIVPSPRDQLLQSLQIFALPVKSPAHPPPVKIAGKLCPSPLISNQHIFDEAAQELHKSIKAGIRPASAICQGQRIPQSNQISSRDQNPQAAPPTPSPTQHQTKHHSSSSPKVPQRPQSAMPKMQADPEKKKERPVSASPSVKAKQQHSNTVSPMKQSFEPLKHRAKEGSTPTVASLLSSREEADKRSLQIRVLKYVAQEVQTAYVQQQAVKKNQTQGESMYDEAAAILPPTRYKRPMSAPISRRPLSATLTSRSLARRASPMKLIEEGQDEYI